jgi:Xaa-Pro aminopeptidase
VNTDLPRLIFAASDRDPDMLYATGFFVPDAFVFLEQNGERTILLSDLEIDRGAKEARVNRVLSVSETVAQLGFTETTKTHEWLPAFLKSQSAEAVAVPQNFPFALGKSLEKAGITLTPVEGLFWPSRQIKRAEEVAQLKTALAFTAAGIARGVEVLAAANPDANGVLHWGGSVLTSERLRAEIDCTVLRGGGEPGHTIVAGGEQACDPHERGSGPLRSNELIILDVFPRHAVSGYYGDMTRTVVRGRASDAQRHLWRTVRSGQIHALEGMRPGVSGKTLHEEIKQHFAQEGYPTTRVEGRWRGFFHGTGHGLGLELHEAPRFSETHFTPGQVLTVEPGIYWPGVGGARIEDVVLITEEGVELLSDAPVVLEV